MTSLEGQWLGRRHILRRIGGGGMGEVYLAEEPHLNRQVAIKVIGGLPTDAVSATPETTLARRQFAQEARAVAALDHPNILALYDYGEQDGIHFLVMPYVKDGSLADLLTRDPQRRFTPPLAPALVAQIIGQCAVALQYAHDHGILHRDVKPQNLLVRLGSATELSSSSGAPIMSTPNVHILLADFGVARFQEELSSQTGATGTPLYSAPEQFAGRPVYASDQYALACAAYLLLTGQPIFRGGIVELYHQHLSVTPTPPSRLNPALSPAVDAVVLRALAKQPDDRFPTVAQFGQTLVAALAAQAPAEAGIASSDGRPTLPPQAPGQAPSPHPSQPAAPSALITPIGAADATTRSLVDPPPAPANAMAHQLSLTELDPARVLREPYTVPDTAHRVGAGQANSAESPTAPVVGLPAVGIADARTQPIPAKRSGGARRGAQQTLLLALAVAIVLAALAGVSAANGGLAALRRLGATGSKNTVSATATQAPTATPPYTPAGFTRIAGPSYSIAYPTNWTQNGNGSIYYSEEETIIQAHLKPIAMNSGYPFVTIAESNQLDIPSMFTLLAGLHTPLGSETITTLNRVQWHARSATNDTGNGVISILIVVCMHKIAATGIPTFYGIRFVSFANYASDYQTAFYPMWQSFAFTS